MIHDAPGNVKNIGQTKRFYRAKKRRHDSFSTRRRLEQRRQGRMIPRFGSPVIVTYPVLPVDNDRPANLRRAALQPAGTMAGLQRRQGPGCRLQRHGFSEAVVKTEQFEGCPGGIGYQHAAVSGRLSERCEVFHLSVADNHQHRIAIGKPFLGAGQFSDLLTAEQSAEMSHKNQYGSLLLPESAKRDPLPVLPENPCFSQTLDRNVHSCCCHFTLPGIVDTACLKRSGISAPRPLKTPLLWRR